MPIEAQHRDPTGDPARDKSQFEFDPTKVTRQRMLSAVEIVKLLDADYERLKQEFGELHSGAAYPRISWSIKIQLSLARPFDPKPFIEIKSKRIASNVVSIPGNEALEGVEPHILSNPDAHASVELERRVTSPNLERIRNGIPIPTPVLQRDGTQTIEPITYPKPQPGETGYGDGDMTIKDSSRELAASAGTPFELTPEEAAALDEQLAAEAAAAAGQSEAEAAAQAAAEAQAFVEDGQRAEGQNELLDPPES